MMKSITHILQIINNNESFPSISFQLIYTGSSLTLKPEIKEVYNEYHKLLFMIENIAQDLIPLEKSAGLETDQEFIKITLPLWFIQESHDKLEKLINNLFKPVQNHIIHIANQFNISSKHSTEKEISSLLLGEPNFSIYKDHIQKYNSYFINTIMMRDHVNYNVGTLNQITAKKELKKHALDIKTKLMTRLITYHFEFNQSICSEFENIKAKALNIPRDAKLLIELSKYMANVSKVTINELEEKIEKSIEMLSSLLDVAPLTGEHMELNKTTINWLTLIQPIFHQNNTLSEAMKSELEDDLQKSINTVNTEVDKIFPELIILDDMDDIKRINEYIDHFVDLIKKLNRINVQVATINSEEQLLKFPETLFPTVTELQEIIVPFRKLLKIIHQWQRDQAMWLDGPYEYLDATIIEKRALDYHQEITEMYKNFKAKIKADVAANKPFRFSGIADDPHPLQQPSPLKLCWQALNEINNLKIYLPLAICMCNPALLKRHWEEMSLIAGFDLLPNAGTTLRKMIDFNLMNNIDKYEVISTGANKELALQEKLTNMINQWGTVSFRFCTEFDQANFVELNEIEIKLEEHRSSIEEMKTSYFIKPILAAIEEFEVYLRRIIDVLDQWDYLQAKIIYYYPVFANVKLAVNLPEEVTLHSNIIVGFKNVQTKLSKEPTFNKIAKNPEIFDHLCNIRNDVEKVEVGVKQFLDKKRFCFPRLFFLSDEEVQKILVQSVNLYELGSCIKKCLPGIKNLEIDDGQILSVIGDQGEKVSFYKSIKNDFSCITQLLKNIDENLKKIIHEKIIECYEKFHEKDIISVIERYPTMVVLCSFHIYWTSLIENCFSNDLSLLKSCQIECSNFLNILQDELKTEVSRRYRNIIMPLIVNASNKHEVIKVLLKKQITRETDIEWAGQLRYYLNDSIEVSIMNSSIVYGCEYSNEQLYVINTTLTDRCYRTIMEAFRYHLYTCLIGKTGTGKTATIKGLIKSLGLQYHLLNTDRNFTHDCMTSIFKGLISSGAWILFENFDRVKPEVLSTTVQQINSICRALSTNLNYIIFEGYRMDLKTSGHICVMMDLMSMKNSNLPDNLRVNFRTCSMLRPDFQKIVEIKLFAGGFQDSTHLSIKLCSIFKLFSEQIVERENYFTDLRLIMSVVKLAMEKNIVLSNDNEQDMILNSLIESTLSSFSNRENVIFHNILHIVFPGSQLLTSSNEAFLKALEKVCSERNLNLNETFKSKAQQILELINTRRAILIMGDALVGKTEMLHSVRNSLSLLKKEKINIGSNIQLETITPNVLDCSQLFGFYNDSKNWIDGFGTKIIRQFSTDDSCDKQWLVFDGSLSAEWIEHLYTVLDNNSLLTLISGEQISIPNSISLFFETDNIHETSPAVISRCGMIYVDLHNLTWKSFVISYIEKQQFFQSNKETIQSLFEWAINSSLEFLKRNSVNSLGELQMVKSIINLFDMHLMEIAQSNLEEKLVNTWTQIILILSIAWGICGNLESDKQSRFNLFSTSLWTGTNEEYPKLKEFKEFNISLPSEGFIQDYFYDFKTNKWKNWKDSLKDQQIPEYNYPYDSCIPTTTSLKFDNLARKHIKFQKPFIVIGNSGTGKTTIIKDFLERKLSSEKYISHILNIYSLLDTKKTQKLMLLKLDKIKKWIYKPAGDKHCVNFIDDLNLDEKSSEIKFVLELTRQYLSTGHWYHNTEIKSLMFDKTLFLYAITKRYRTIDLCPRFARYFDIYTIESLDSENLYRIFSTTLLNKWTNNQLNADVSGSVTGMVNGTISLYNFVIKAFEPTPSKMQYRFLISDVARVINGCSLIQKESIESKATFIRLWAHENWRVFSDRMLEDNDKQILFEAIVECVKKNFKDSFESVFDHLPKSEDGQITKGSFDSLYFANFLDFEKSTKRYEEVNSHETLRTKIMQYLSEYNDKNEKRIHMAISRYVLENFVKISRSLAVPAGENVILVAPEGSGKKSTTKLAAFAQRQTFFEASAESSYDSRVWREDLKRVLMQCGTEEEDAVFLIVEESLNQLYLRDVSSLSSTGEVQGLFSYEEKNEIIQKTRLMAQNGKRNAEFDSFTVLRYFAHRCRNKSHLVLCFCPTSNSLKIYLHTYPALLKNFLINCYDYWPTGSLTQVAAHYVERSKISEPEIKSLVSACVGLHEMANNFFSRSKKKNLQSSSQSCFLHMCGLYVDLVGRKGEEILDSIRKYLAGLEKLESAGRRVVEMRETLGVLKPRLESSARRAMETMQEIEAENASVERYKTQVKLDEEIANRKTEIAGRLRGECEAELAFAIPILEDAIQALNTLRPMDVTLCKAMKNPPDTVKLVMAAVCVMLEVPPDRIIDPADGKKMLDYWGPSKRILGDMNFLPILKDYDKDNIPTTAIQSIKKTFMTDKNFLPSIVAKASSAAEGLCKWVRAMVAYDEIAKAVAPKKEKLAAAQIECDQAESFLGEKRKALASLTAKLTILKDSLEETERKKVALESEIDLCTRKLRKAERLIDSLGNEKERWQECARNVQESYDNLCGNLLLSSGTIAYLASCTLEDRRIVVKSWKDLLENLKIPVSGVYSLVGTLYDERETILWRLSGFLAENATVVKLSLLRCLIVDPQGQASEWIGRIEEGNGLRVGTLNDDDSMGIIRRGMEQGTPVLLESIDDNLSVNLVTILKKLVHKIEDNWYLDVADETLKNKQDFRLYFTSKLAKQFYTSDKFHGLTIVDFTISRKVLENKLLDIAFSKENPRMQEKFENISLRDLESKKSIQEQEDRILNILSQSSGNILEDENAIDMMKAFKNTLMDIVDQEEAERDVLININAKRQVYAEFVEYCSDLYDTLTSLSYLNRMYQFALSWFLNIYSKAIEESKISVKTEKRLKFLKDSITKNLHLSVCNWLYEEHKFLYTFIFQTKILLHNNEATKSEIETFIHGPNKNYVKIVKPVPKWIPEDSWKEICWIDENLPGFQNIANDLQKNDEWEVFFQPETFLPKSMPFAWKNKLTSFQKLILIKILRPDEIYVEITRLMEKDDLLSLAFDHSSQLKISLAFEESHCVNPILILLPSIFNPISLVASFAKRMKCSCTFSSLSLGEGLDATALNLIENARIEGAWVFLENSHLNIPLMRKIERIFDDINLHNTPANFRLWISSCSSQSFPTSLLQKSTKLVYDESLRFKENLLQIYQTEFVRKSYFLKDCPGKEKLFSRLLYNLCFFHTLVKERNNFGTSGWHVPYNFDLSDFQISARQLKSFINERGHWPLDTYLYTIGDCNYANKIFDDFDKNCLKALLRDIYSTNDSIFKNHSNFAAPRRLEYRDMIAHIENLPIYLPPEIFGVHRNTIIGKNLSISSRFFESLSSLHGDSRDSLFDDDDIRPTVLSMINEMENNLPNIISEEKVFKDEEQFDSMLHQEMEFNNSIVQCVRDTFTDVRLALNGTKIPTAEIEEFCVEIFQNLVPKSWKRKYHVRAENLGAFVVDISEHFNEIQKLIKREVPFIVNFNRIHFPRVFLTGCLLSYCKKYNIIPDNKIRFKFYVTSAIDPINLTNTCENMYFINGLHLFGARWDLEEFLLINNAPNKFSQKMPLISFTFTSEQCDLKQEEYYECPLYHSICNEGEINSNFITTIPLKTNLSQTRLSKLRVLLFCSHTD